MNLNLPNTDFFIWSKGAALKVFEQFILIIYNSKNIKEAEAARTKVKQKQRVQYIKLLPFINFHLE